MNHAEMEFLDLVSWIHRLLPGDARAVRIAEARRRALQGSPTRGLTLQSGPSPGAGTYFLRLPGNVSTLGGIRAESGFELPGIDLLRQAVEDEYEHGVDQVQAVVADDDSHTPEFLLKAGFEKLTVVLHVVRGLQSDSPASDEGTLRQSDGEIAWVAAERFAESRLAKLVVETFEQTKDCPELNGLRSPREVLDGLLDGNRLRRQEDWLVLVCDGQLAGCLLMQRHIPGELVELSYMGLSPEFRGRGLGQNIMQRAIDVARRLGANVLAAAVDARNLPALRVYQANGFKRHASLQVWLHRRIV